MCHKSFLAPDMSNVVTKHVKQPAHFPITLVNDSLFTLEYYCPCICQSTHKMVVECIVSRLLDL